MALQLNVNGVDKSSNIDWPSLQKMDVLTKEPDRLEFRIKNYGSKTYRPTHSDEVILLDGGVKIFGGHVIETTETNDGLLKYFQVVCSDYSFVMDGKLVNKTYENQTVAAIISDIVSLYLPAGFTTTHVNGLSNVPKIVFNDEQPSKCFQRLADFLGTYDWYVDYDKDIHFFAEGDEPAPFGLTDTNDSYIFGSLSIQRDISQVRNSIIVRGGDKQSGTLTDTKIADGQQKTFVAKPSLQSLTIEKSTNAGSSWSTLTIGQDGVTDATTKDVLYNPNNGFVIFRDDNKLANGNYLRWSGVQVYPIKIIRRDTGSIALYGERQYVIRDATIKSEEQAKQRASAEIEKYGNRANEGVFRTYASGLRSGMSIDIQSTALGISTETHKVTRVILRARTISSFEYEVHTLASEDFGVLDAFAKLLVNDPATQFKVADNEVLVQAEAFTEEMELVESFTTTKYPRGSPTFTEASTVAESWTVNPFGLNVNPIWVLGDYYPSGGGDRKRVFRLDSSAKLA